MDPHALVALLQKTLIPNSREAAEEELNTVHKIIGFCPKLLQIIMAEDLDIPTRQAGVIYFKNFINQAWQARESDGPPGTPLPFAIHEQDKAEMRGLLVEAMVKAPDVIRTQLAVCVCRVIKHDFPQRWPDVVDKINIFLQTQEVEYWPGALLALYQLVKCYEYKKKEDRRPLNEAMNLLLPHIYAIMCKLLEERAQPAEEVKKLVLKIFYSLTQYIYPTDLISRAFFTQWMEIFKRVVEQDVPPHVNEADEDERPQLIWWKTKKWAMHIVTRIFERYGSPGNVSKEYKDFSDFYLKTYSAGIIQAVLKVLDQYRTGVYVSPRVMQQGLNYINTAVSHGLSWKFIKPHILEVVKDVIFPLMSYTRADAELWETDPYEYIRVKFDVFEDFVSPVTAAQTLLHSICKKRKDVLPKTMEMLLHYVQSKDSTPSQKDGALHMIGTMSDILLKKKLYKDQMEQFLQSLVYPEFVSPHGHLRARACWMLHYFADVKYSNPQVLRTAFDLTIERLLTDKEAPVKVEAAIALQMMLSSQGDVARPIIEPRIKEITRELLNVIRDTENDDLTSVMQKIVCTYTEQLIPVAVDMCKHLVETFSQVLDSTDDGDDKAITAMGLLNTMETILTVMEDRADVHAALEPIVLQAVHHIFSNSIMEFYEEALSLTCDLTSTKISADMWTMLRVIYEVFQRDGFDYFTDMMPTLHNYVTVDTKAFISTTEYAGIMFEICKKVLTSEPGEDPECHAAKLLEVIILQCKGMGIDAIIPSFLELVFSRLQREVKTSELRTMCLQVAIATMYYDHTLFFATLEKSSIPGVEGSLMIQKFVDQWLSDADCFIGLHDRKLCVIGLCQLLTLPHVPGVGENAHRLLPSLLMLFSGLKRAYEVQAENENDSDDSDSDSDGDDGDGENEILDSDEDEVDEKSQMYLESLQDKIIKSPYAGNIEARITDGDDDDDDEDEYSDDEEAYEETSLENYTTPIDEDATEVDEYQIFTTVIKSVESERPDWYKQLLNSLSNEDRTSLQDILTLSAQRKAAKESKSIEKAGGYVFNQQSVPGAFNFVTSPGGTQHFAFGGSNNAFGGSNKS